ncbi:GNAT family N-acetyltransferase [Paraglaciecola sp. 2405UD69-4]|uniref:GNAT family N-acetyltransferase n=1 Tax=Paraglaciecola sp. 2405UD69-4 TaxID=3391836 RepID=UPI0039C9B918
MKLTIRHAEAQDYDDLVEIYRFPSVTQNTSQLLYLDTETIKSFFKPNNQLVLVAENEGKVVGHVTLILSHKQREKHGASLAIAVHPNFHGQGVGKTLMKAAIDQADNWLNLLRIELEVYADNKSAYALYEKLGFEIEGEKRCASFKNGKYVNLLMMSRLKP